MGARRTPVSSVRAELKRYAERGSFGSFSETNVSNGSIDFCFNWLWKLPFRLTFDPARKALIFPKLLPGVDPASDLNADIKAFLKGCSSDARPEHRRLDPKRVAVRYSNRRGSASVTLQVVAGDYEYAVKRAINLVNELFVGFLNVRYPEYMIRAFRLPEE